MSAKSKITCACGRQIEGREVLQQGYFMNHWKPVWVFVKYRCSRCRMLGEQLVDYEQWEEGALGPGPGLHAVAAPPATAPLGEIDEGEVQEFAEHLRTLRSSDLDKLAGSLP